MPQWFTTLSEEEKNSWKTLVSKDFANGAPIFGSKIAKELNLE